MELSLSGFLIFLGLPLLLGATVLRSLGLGLRTDPIAYPGWAWMVGSLAVAALEALRLALGWSSPWGPAGLALLGAVVVWGGVRSRPLAPLEGEERPWASYPLLERAFFQLVLLLVLADLAQLALGSSLTLIHANDEANFWSMRAKLLHDGGGFGESYAAALRQGRLPNSNYPLLNPLLQVWVFDCAGGITHVANRFPTQLATLALVLCAAGAFRRLCRPWIAGVLVLALGTCAPLGTAVRQANSDVLVALGGLVVGDAVLRASSDTQRRAWVALGALGCAFLLGAKREGLLLFLCGASAYVVWNAWREGARATLHGLRSRAREAGPWLAAPLAVWLGTQLHNAWFHTRGSHEIRAEIVDRLREHAHELPLALASLTELGARPLTNAIPVVFALLALLAWPRRSRALGFLPLACLLFVLGLCLAIVQGGKADYLLRNAALRVLSQVLPLMLLWIATLAPELTARWIPSRRAMASARATPSQRPRALGHRVPESVGARRLTRTPR